MYCACSMQLIWQRREGREGKEKKGRTMVMNNIQEMKR